MKKALVFTTAVAFAIALIGCSVESARGGGMKIL